MNQYRLLRSNKETGPYSADQLIKLGLKQYDLVWVDGKSAAWRYPCEMEEFKAYAPEVEEQPFDRFFKKTAGAKPNTPRQDVPTAQVVAAPAPKPRIRVKADWNRIAEPIVEVRPPAAVAQPQAQVQVQVNQPEVKAPINPTIAAKGGTDTAGASWKSAWLDWQQEQKVVELATKTEEAAGEERQVEENATPAIETKFSQSLDGLKQHYADTVLKAKEAAVKWYKFKGLAICLLLAVPVLGLGLYLGSNLHSNNPGPAKVVVPAGSLADNNGAENTATQPAANENAPAAGNSNQVATPQKPAPKNSKEVIPAFEDRQAKAKNNDDDGDEQASQPVAKQQAQPIPVTTTPKPAKQTKVASQPLQNQPVINQPRQQYAFTPPATNNPAGRAKVINPALSQNTPAYQAAGNQPASQNGAQENMTQAPIERKPENTQPVFMHASKKQKVEDFVLVEPYQNSAASIKDLALNVSNITDAPVDMAVIDVEYFDEGGKFKTGQTIYVKNIPVSETVPVKIPEVNNAVRIKYKVSLVSVEQKGVYLVAE